MTKQEVAVVAILSIFFAFAFGALAGCSGPSKSRYKELLAECRAHEREYVRINGQLSANRAQCVEMRRGQSFDKVPMSLRNHALICPLWVAPQQKLGAVGFGEGGQ